MNELNLELFSFDVFKDEKWSFIPNIKNKYIVSTHGRVALFIKGRYKLASVFVSKQGYPTFRYSEKGKSYNHRIHRLVGITFIPNPNNYPQINHIDENRTNNRVENLEWCTAKHNLEHSGIIKKWYTAGNVASLSSRSLRNTVRYSSLNDIEPKKFKRYIDNKVRNFQRLYSERNIYGYNEFHECVIYENIHDACLSTNIDISHIIISASYNDRSGKLMYHSNGIFFSLGHDFWSWIISDRIDVAHYFKER